MYLAQVIPILWVFSDLRGRDSKKPRGQYLNGVRFQKKFGFPIFLAQGKNLTPIQVEIKKWPQKDLPYQDILQIYNKS